MNELSNTDVLILAGGKGTRLRSVVSDVPKVLAAVGGRPFLLYLLDYIKSFGTRRIVFCTGYMGKTIRQAVGENYNGMTITYSREIEPLGTAGALRLAMDKTETENLLVLNGDTMVMADYDAFLSRYAANDAQAAVLLVSVPDVSRYGSVRIDQQNRIVSFVEKDKHAAAGLINAGAYLFNRGTLMRMPSGINLSLENDFLPRLLPLPLYGFVQQAAFLDIGTPESFSRAEKFLSENRSAQPPGQ